MMFHWLALSDTRNVKGFRAELSLGAHSIQLPLSKKQMNQKPGTVIMEQGTVSGCVLDISRFLGAKKVL